MVEEVLRLSWGSFTPTHANLRKTVFIVRISGNLKASNCGCRLDLKELRRLQSDIFSTFLLLGPRVLLSWLLLVDQFHFQYFYFLLCHGFWLPVALCYYGNSNDDKNDNS